MAALQTPTPCPDCDCSGSPLSGTGNILGILTFAVAVYASLLYYYRGFRASKVEMRDLEHKVSLASNDLSSVVRRCQTKADEIRNLATRHRLNMALLTAKDCVEEAQVILARRSGDEYPGVVSLRGKLGDAWMCVWYMYSLRDRAAYILEKDDVLKVLEKMEQSLGGLKGVASEVFSQ